MKLLTHPDERLADRLRTVDELHACVTGPAARTGPVATPATAGAKCSPSPRCTAMPAPGHPSTRPRLPAGGAGVRRHRRPRCGPTAAPRVPGVDRRRARALAECRSSYADIVAAVCETLPSATDQQVLRAQRLAQACPPAEAVGLQPFTLTVPHRRNEGDR